MSRPEARTGVSVPPGWDLGTTPGRAGPATRVRQQTQLKDRTALALHRCRAGQCTTTGGMPASSSRWVSSRLRGRNIAGITVSSTIAQATQ